MNELDNLRLYYLEYLFEILEHFPEGEMPPRWEVWDYLCQYSRDVRGTLVRQYFEESLN
jgi:hypothetical protein